MTRYLLINELDLSMRSMSYTAKEIAAVAQTFREAADFLDAGVQAMSTAELEEVSVHFASLKNTFAGRVFSQAQKVFADIQTEIRNKAMGAPTKAEKAIQAYRAQKNKRVQEASSGPPESKPRRKG